MAGSAGGVGSSGDAGGKGGRGGGIGGGSDAGKGRDAGSDGKSGKSGATGASGVGQSGASDSASEGPNSGQAAAEAAANEASSTAAASVADGVAGVDSGANGSKEGKAAAEAAANEAAAAQAATVSNDAKADAQAAADEAAAAQAATAASDAKSDAQAAADEAAAAQEASVASDAKSNAQAAADEAAAAQAANVSRDAKADAQAAADEAVAAQVATVAHDAKAAAQKAADEAAAAQQAVADMEAKNVAERSSYSVRAGDTLSQIAQKNGVSLASLTAANPQIADPNSIAVGQQISVPGARANAAEVAAVQSRLGQLGYAVGPIDGIAGPKTDAAVKSFQAASGLKATGVIDAATAHALGQRSAKNAATSTTAVPNAVAAPATAGVQGLLDAIARAEGTHEAKAAKMGFKTGYDVTLGYGAYTPAGFKDKALTSMTIGEVKSLQRGMLSHPKNKMNSSAVGRYQMVGTTLRSVQKELGIPNSAKFDAKTQDRMATALLGRRGLQSFKTGRISARAFQDQLAREWASVPMASTGRSYYSKQVAGAPRHAPQPVGISARSLQSALRNL